MNKEPFTMEEAREMIADQYFEGVDYEIQPHRQWSDMEEILIDLGKIDFLVSLYKDAIELYCPEEDKKEDFMHPLEPYKDKENTSIFPPFIWFGKIGACAMRLQVDNQEQAYYYRDGGNWGVTVHVGIDKDGNSIYLSADHSISSISNQPCFPCTEEEWRNDNGEYAPDLNKNINPEQEDELPF